jgi:hypothetical protein
MGPPLQREEVSDYSWRFPSYRGDLNQHSLTNWPSPTHADSVALLWLRSQSHVTTDGPSARQNLCFKRHLGPKSRFSLLAVKVSLRPTVSRPVGHGVKPHLGPKNRLFLLIVKVSSRPTVSRPVGHGVKPHLRPKNRLFLIIVKVSLRPTVSRSLCQAPSGAQDQVFVTVRQLQFCLCGTPNRKHCFSQFLYCCVHNCCYVDVVFVVP